MNQKQDIELPLLSRKDPNRASFQTLKDDTPSPSDPTKKKPKFKSHFTQYLDASADPKKYSSRPSFLRWITFTDMMPHVRRMNEATREFTINDLPNPEAKFNVEAKVIELDQQWANELKTSDKPQFYKALYRTFLREIIQACLLVFLENLCKILYSIFMGQIISIITAQNIGEDVEGGDLFFSATILSILVILSIFAKGWSYFVVAPNLCKARLTVSGLLYKKLNSISMTSLHEIKIGKVINLIANDLNDIQHIFFFPLMVVTPYMIALGTYVMWGYFGPSCLIGVASLILVVFCQIYLSNFTGGLRQENKRTADERVKYTHEVIEGIRLIKMYTWDRLFQQKISDLRKNEHKTFLKIAYVDSLGINLSGLCVYLNILLICIVHTMTGGQLTPANVYASMMILMYLSALLLGSHQARTNLVNTRVVLSRVEEVLKIKDVLLLEETSESDDKESSSASFSKKKKPVVFKNFTGYWNQTTSVPCLSDISLTFNPGTLTAVIGKIGSGKSSLLLSFLREMPVTKGSLDYSGKIAYVEQDPIIFSGTIQQNILFGRDYNEPRYKKVIEDCRLTRDLQLFPHGDQTMIGERGVNLSGGQKARISLARALYSESDIYLLDDPFSALDSRVSREIFDKVFKGSLAKEKTVILVTHHLNFAKEAGHVVLLEEGRVEAEGSFEDLEKMNIGLLSVFKVDGHKKMSEDSIKVGKKDESKNDAEHEVSNTPEKNHTEEATQVSWSTYKEYFKTGGSRNTFILLALLFVANHGLMIYFSRYVGFWAEDQTLHYSQQNGSEEVKEFDNSPYINKLVLMFSILFVLSYTKTARVYQLFYTSNSELHQKMLNALVRSKVLFFDINPVGRILNRFSNDMGIFDKLHGRVCLDCFDNLMNYITVLITVCLINPLIIFSVVLVMFGLYQIRKMFEKPMRTVKKVELMSKGPMISAIPATLQGLIVIRVYNQGGRYVKDFMGMLYNNIKAFVYLEKTIRLFGFLLDTPIQLLTISAVWFFLILIFNYHIAAGMLGLSLMYLLKIGDQGSMMIRQTLMIDINMQSAQRMIDYSRIKSEAPTVVEEKDNQVEQQFQGRWPTRGEIEFNKVSLRYREELGLALNGLTLKVPGGLKVACIGRTGAGKSSIIQALFRMVEIEDGPNYQDSAIKIDGVDIKSIGLNLLRSRLSIIPQTPVIFADTIKKNLDPFGTLSDDRIWNVLEEVGLKDYVSSLQKGLDTDMTVSSTVFSTGQKQLICLARAIVSKSKVIILDEATANVDVETDSFIQRAIMEKFKDCTVLTVAHRLITIANYDKVVVIDAGRVAEYDSPYSLLVERIGDSRITKKDGLFAEMVRSTGRSMAQKIFDVARDHYCTQATKFAQGS